MNFESSSSGNTLAVSFDVTTFGAVGDGITLDSPAINRTIDAAAAAGRGTVFFPAGIYLSFSIRLKSHITLHLAAGATILAADPTVTSGGYDPAEPNKWDAYQDFGHSHWHNSLIWGEGLENVSILGPGLIHGKGLTRWGPGPQHPAQEGDSPLSLDKAHADATPTASVVKSAYGKLGAGSRGFAPPGFADEPLTMEGQGNKAIALKLCRNVTLRDFSILQGGHFALLATGVDDLLIDNLSIDTNRDGLDIDCCHRVEIRNTCVNSPNDDGICLKSSYALGHARATENVVITRCRVTGYDPGTLLDGTYGRTQEMAPDKDPVTGRIKCGTESNGGFRNITITDCVCERSRGLALETVDGGIIEDVIIRNIVMKEVTTSPLFLRLGNRARGPRSEGGTGVGTIRRVSISNITVHDVDPLHASILAGLPGHPIEDVSISNLIIVCRGGGTAGDATRGLGELEAAYPEPSMFGTTPAYGFFIRHVKNLRMSDMEISYEKPEMRPALVLDDVEGAHFDRVKAQFDPEASFFILRGVKGFTAHNCPSLHDTVLEETKSLALP